MVFTDEGGGDAFMLVFSFLGDRVYGSGVTVKYVGPEATMGVGGGHTSFSCRLSSHVITKLILCNARVGSVHSNGTSLISACYVFRGNRV